MLASWTLQLCAARPLGAARAIRRAIGMGSAALAGELRSVAWLRSGGGAGAGVVAQ